MVHLFPYDNIVAGILILMVGFLFHWIGQLISVINWDLATRLGLQESELPKEYKVYEHAIAVADSFIGWVYGIIAYGLFFNLNWSWKLLWIPGIIFIYHGISYWFWTGNRRRDGHKLVSDPTRFAWPLVNLLTGVLSVLMAWHAN